MAKELTIEDCTDCWYVNGDLNVVDVIHPESGLTWCFKEDAAGVQARHPGAVRMAFDDALKSIDALQTARFVKPVSEVSEEDFTYALEVLPPSDWKSWLGVESFKMIERTCGSITQIFARCGDRYFTLADRYSLPASEIADRVGAYLREHPVANPQPYFVR